MHAAWHGFQWRGMWRGWCEGSGVPVGVAAVADISHSLEGRRGCCSWRGVAILLSAFSPQVVGGRVCVWHVAYEALCSIVVGSMRRLGRAVAWRVPPPSFWAVAGSG